MMKVFFTLMISFMLTCSVKAQHCRFDGSVVLVLDIKNKSTDLPVPNLNVKLVDKDSLPYYRTSWSYLPNGYPIEKRSDYMKFTYVSQEIFDQLNKDDEKVLPSSLLHKYIIWAGPATYRNAFPLNWQKKLYLQDKATIGVMKNYLVGETKYIHFMENTLLSGCTGSALWKEGVNFQTVYFSDEEIKAFEKVKKK